MIDVWDQFIHSPQSFYLMYAVTYICYLWFCNMSCLGWLAVGFTSILDFAYYEPENGSTFNYPVRNSKKDILQKKSLSKDLMQEN